MLAVIIFFLFTALILYVLFGGADFGAGVLETFLPKKNRETIAHAIAPIWEANHVWLVLVVVILFVGFPKVYATVSNYLHIPILIVLLGVVLRGTAFTFRYYDPQKKRSEPVYSIIFQISSFVTPLFIGVTAGGMFLGKIHVQANTFAEGFINPWWNAFSFSLGLFTCCLFTFLAAVYLIGEAANEAEKKNFINAAKISNIILVVLGGLVFITANWNGFPLLEMFLDSTGAIVAVVIATVNLPLLWRFIHHGQVQLTRILAGVQTILIIGAFLLEQYPVLVHIADTDSLTIQNTVAPDAVIKQLMIALIIGSSFIFPSLIYLFKIFKREQF
ncbi:cytochrome d ubiquinol oxidase subunit II [Rapidithrix thailandica]|uniref:Cytochrome d ubiquinol oxidase subunit II n=1 Tax=Rapidithrix thailandica TaxID=413964 RepID=A0AAW9RU32_9BACT